MNGILIIRACNVFDEKIWIELNREFMEDEIKDSEFWHETEKSEDAVFSKTFHEALDHPEMINLLIAELDEQAVGFANLMSIYSVWAHGPALILDDIFVRPEFQGQGIGREMMKYIESYAKDRGYKRLQFQSEFSNKEARAFYGKLGYEPMGMNFYARYLKEGSEHF